MTTPGDQEASPASLRRLFPDNPAEDRSGLFQPLSETADDTEDEQFARFMRTNFPQSTKPDLPPAA
jgi:hypothetical protein